MKIKIYCEDKRHPDFIEVSDEDCQIWVENDYQFRLANAIDKSSVVRRTPQEIMDEKFNKPTFNNEHTETRRHCSLDALDPLGDTVGDPQATAEINKVETDYDLEVAINKLLPEQRELIISVFFQGINQSEIAKEDGVTEVAVSRRVGRALIQLKKILLGKK